jgi:hypothetical protein
MRLLTAISLALVALMALACTATPATPAPTPLPTPNFSKSEILELVKDRSNRSCLSTDAHVITGAERVTIAKRRGVMGNPSKAPYDYETVRYPYSVVSGSFWNKIDITYKPSGVWLVVAKAGWEEKNENGTEKTISDSCTFRIDDGTGSLIK